MNYPENPFTKALAQKDKQIGLWVGLCDGYAAETIAPAGYDWVVLDMEHSPNTLDKLLSQMQAFDQFSTTALVRPEWNDTVLIKRLLDLGARGLVIPMVQNVDEAKAAVAATRYPPNGNRGFGGTSRANAFGRMPDYLAKVEQETTVILQIETQEAMNNAEEIASVDGVDGIFFGPADIAADLGYPGQSLHPAVWDAIRPVAKKLMDMGMPVGTLVLDAKFAAELLNEGFTFVACGIDTAILARGADALLASVKDQTS